MTWYHIKARHYRHDGQYFRVDLSVEAPDLQSAVARLEFYAVGWEVGAGGSCVFEEIKTALGPLPNSKEYREHLRKFAMDKLP